MLSKIVCSLASGGENPRNSEGAFIKLNSGRILFIYSRFTGESWHDHCTADLAMCFSDDNGETWRNAPDLFLKREEEMLNLMSVSLLRLHSGKIALLYCCKKQTASGVDCRPLIRFSQDEGESWSVPREIIPTPGFFVVNNDRLVQLKSGRLLVPAALHPRQDGVIGNQGTGCMFYSDNEGITWQEALPRIYSPSEDEYGFQEPCVLELQDGTIMQYFRTGRGCLYKAFSQDNGLSWSEIVPAPEFPSPLSPLSIKRNPYSGILYAVWNDYHPQRRVDCAETRQKRTPLVIAESCDEGKTWSNHQVLENNPRHGYAYTAMLFLENSLLLAYCCGYDVGEHCTLQDSCIRKIDLPLR